MSVDDWHVSDHRPINLHVTLDCSIDLTSIMVRAQDLNYDDLNTNNVIISQFTRNHNFTAIKKCIVRA